MLKKSPLISLADIKALSEYVINRERTERGFKQSIISMYEYNAKWSNLFFRSAIHVVSFFLRPSSKRKKYMFWGTKFEELILSLPAEEVCIVGGPKQLIFCLKNRRAFLPEMSFWHFLVDELKGGSHPANMQRLSSSISALSQRLRRIADENALLIIDNDSLPAQRAVIQAFRMSGVGKSICIQDGVFQKKSPSHIYHGWFADRFFVIDNNQKVLLVEKGMSAEKIKVMGFHSTPYQPKRVLSPPKHRRICLIGQPWWKYGEERGERYLSILQEITNILQKSGYAVSFKPHPWERGSNYLKNIPDVIDISMAQALEQYDVFISLTSTALLEAVASGRVAVQVVDSAFDADRFCDFSEVASISSGSYELSDELINCVKREPLPKRKEVKPLVKRFQEALSGKN
ncbi:hypothetical protein GPM19_05340 [Halomonas sp. ZH2S]|uniref:Uncharacterized protein n=1 Tax=Vreelandella zhuhanensis TaxID=2684210 RepID=A0A7X3GZ95_9GAMM|nr:hypothetical protein [Halomonas zhuhanensis]MWJ27635.1 hypothetical protein [Halomonas zhuhanensis]